MKGLTLTEREQGRLQTLNLVLGRQMGVGEAAYVLGLSERQTWRMVAAYRKHGAKALSHGNRERQPPSEISEVMRERIVVLVRERYQGVNHAHLTELLEEWEGIVISRSTVRRLLMNAGLSSPRNRRPRHRHGVCVCHRKECSCRWMAVVTAGWKSEVHGSPRRE